MPVSVSQMFKVVAGQKITPSPTIGIFTTCSGGVRANEVKRHAGLSVCATSEQVTRCNERL